MKLHIGERIAAGCLFIGLLAAPAAAASRDGNALSSQCQVDSNLAVIACHIYIHAVLDVLDENAIHGYRVCVPENMDIDRSVKVFVDWLSQHADVGQLPASDLVAHALWETYPCK